MRKSIAILFVLIIAIILGSFFLLKNFYFISKAAFLESSAIIINHGEVIELNGEGQAIIEEEAIYIPLMLLEDQFGINTDYDELNKIAIITTEERVFRFYGEVGRVEINHKESAEIPRMIILEDNPMIPISHMKDDLLIESNFVKETEILILSNLSTDQMYGEILDDHTRLRVKDKLFSEVMEIMNKGDRIQLFDEDGDWIKIVTDKGIMGYVHKNKIHNINVIKGIIHEKVSPNFQEEPILLVWEHVHAKNPDTTQIGEMKGVNVISPTWLSLRDRSGTISNKIDYSYIQWAKEKGFKIWPLFGNQFDPELTSDFLNNALARESAIKGVLKLILDNGLDGINIDFENVFLKDRDKLVQFVRELVPIFHQHGLLVSMDVTVLSTSENWSLCYDRQALGEALDYVAVMTYDEHWSSSPVSGSVASLAWVERGIHQLLEEVPAEKLILGIPFYTRLWTETPTDEGMKVSSQALGMKAVNDLVEKYKLQKIWDETAGQHYVEYQIDGKTHKIWIEDSESIILKSDLVNKYNLAGAAAWRRGFETPDIWDVLDRTLNQ